MSGYIINNGTTVVDNDNYYDCRDTEDVEIFHDAPTLEPLTNPPPVTLHGNDIVLSDSLTATPTDTNELSSVRTDDPTSPTLLDVVSETNIPTLATPTSTLHVVSKNGDYGPSQERLYDNLDQYAYLELDASLIKGSHLDCNTIYELEQWIFDTTKRSVNVLNSKEKEPDWNHWQRCLGYFPMDIIKRTKDCTTNYGLHHDVGILKRHRKSRNPQLNRKRLMEKYATDTWYASVKAVAGETCAQIFVGMSSFYTYVIGMKTESDGPQALNFYQTTWSSS